MRLKRAVIVIVVIVCLAAVAAGFYGSYENKRLVVTEYTVTNARIPEEFSGFVIAQVSDFHNAGYEGLADKIVAEVKRCEPDIIAITGDFIDSRNTQVNFALDFAEKLTDIAPVYYVTGNHEGRIDEYKRLKNGLENLGVNILENECVQLKRGEDMINLIGLEDPSFNNEKGVGGKRVLSKWINQIDIDYSCYTVLLEHHSEYIGAFTENEIDLALTGHAHGGQIRLPFIGGLYAPGQGLFPEYDGGMYELSDTSTMIVSRGIGNSAFPVRLNNPPELVAIKLEKESGK